METLPTPKSIRDQAEAAGLSIAGLCERAKVDPATYWRWHNGKHSPKLAIVSRWLEAIDNAKTTLSPEEPHHGTASRIEEQDERR